MRYYIFAWICLNLLLNWFFREDLYLAGNNIILQMQTHSSWFIDYIMLFLTMLIDPIVVVLSTLMFLILCKNKSFAYQVVIFIILNTYLTGILKAIYADPRPIWTNSQILNIGFYCPHEYANPSGHSWFSVIATFGILLPQTDRSYLKILISVLIVILVPFSRMYLGAHSLNQILQGVSFGFCMVYIYLFEGLQDQIKCFLKDFNSDPNKIYPKTLILAGIISMIAYIINLPELSFFYTSIPLQWRINIKRKCGKDINAEHLNFMILMVNTLLVSLSIGIGYAYRHLVNNEKGRVFLSGKWDINVHYYSYIQGYTYYIIIQLFILILPFIPLFMILKILSHSKVIIFFLSNLCTIVGIYFATKETYLVLFKRQIIKLQVE